jgi:hypothetical protein
VHRGWPSVREARAVRWSALLAHLPHLFERFYRIDASRPPLEDDAFPMPEAIEETAGSGLGLSIVRWVVESHGGRVGVSSMPGTSSTFEVFLRALDQQQGLGPSPAPGPVETETPLDDL